jgi:hypothetical protein
MKCKQLLFTVYHGKIRYRPITEVQWHLLYTIGLLRVILYRCHHGIARPQGCGWTNGLNYGG